jgi:hypothetical protein
MIYNYGTYYIKYLKSKSFLLQTLTKFNDL